MPGGRRLWTTPMPWCDCISARCSTGQVRCTCTRGSSSAGSVCRFAVARCWLERCPCLNGWPPNRLLERCFAKTFQLCSKSGSLLGSRSGSLKRSLAQAPKSMFLQRSPQKGRNRLLGPYTLGPPQLGQRTVWVGASLAVFTMDNLKRRGSVRTRHLPAPGAVGRHRPCASVARRAIAGCH